MHLPNEVLAEIFIYANENAAFRLQPRFVPVESDFPIMESVPTSRLPSFAQVCTQWRVAAFACSRLWDTLTIIWPTDGSRTTPLSTAMKNKKEMCEQWIKRSGSRPLSISFSLEDSDNLDSRIEIAATKAMISTISPHLHRLRHFHILCHFPTLAKAFKSIDSTKLPLLETISLEDISESGGSKSWWFQYSFIGCRNLRSLVVDHDSFLIEHATPVFPWSQLTYLDSTSELFPCKALEIIEACPNLEHAGLFLTSEFWGHVRFVTSHLKSLHVSGASLSCTGFLHLLILPNIETFHLNAFNDHFEDGENIELLSILDGVFSRSKSPLKSLSLVGDRPFSPDDTPLLTLLNSLPHLEALSLRERLTCLMGHKNPWQQSWLSKDTLRDLAAGKILPGLQCLRLECPTALTEGILKDLVKNRRSRLPDSEERAILDFLFVVMKKPLGAAALKALRKDVVVISGRTDYAYNLLRI